jgi:hypothetical protein
MILWTFALTCLVILVAMFDPGFLSSFAGLMVIPVSTGDRIEVLVTQGAPFAQSVQTDLYFLSTDSSFTKAANFTDMPQCVDAYRGELFVTFRQPSLDTGGASSIFKDGKWARSVSAPIGFNIVDVASFGDTMYALGMGADNKKIELCALGETGWQRVPDAYDAGKEITYAGSVAVRGGIDILYATGKKGRFGTIDLESVRWFHVLFDGKNWGAEEPLNIPEGKVPCVSPYEGELALLLLSTVEGEPVQLATVKQGKLDVIARIPTADKGLIVRSWLVDLGGNEHVFLVGLGKLWDVPLANMKPGAPRLLLEVPSGSLVRSRLYVGLAGGGAVLLVSLGIAWLVMRLRTLRRRSGA